MKMILFSKATYSGLFNDAAAPWQIGFQEVATPTMEGIVELHDQILFYLIVILVFISWILSSILYQYSFSKRGALRYKYENHGTLIELIWTITPAFILIAIAFPSFKLLYLMDNSIYQLSLSHFALISMKKLNSSCTDLVVYGKVGPTTFIRFNNYVRNLTIFPKHIISQLIGHLLGDGALVMSKTSKIPCACAVIKKI